MKIPRIVVGTLGGGFVSAMCVASLSWIVIFNSDPGFGVEGPHPEWATLAALLGGIMGSIVGLPLGLIISLLRQGPIQGTFLGLLAGLLLVIWASQTGGHPDVIYPTLPLLISFFPAGAFSGFLTSVLVSRLFEEEAVER